jgi:hypothetical protein
MHIWKVGEVEQVEQVEQVEEVEKWKRGKVEAVSSGRVRRATVLSIAFLLLLAVICAAAELKAASARAYETHAAETTRTFVERARRATLGARCDGVMTAKAGSSDGIMDVPDGLIHHWIGSAFIRGATLKQAIDVSRAYANYPRVYKAVVSSRVLSQQGDEYQVLIRLKEGEAGITAVLDVRSKVEYRSATSGASYAISHSEEIREVENAGKKDEKLLPVGHDSGYLWRAHTLTYFAPDEGGVFVVMETLGLSRQFPIGFGWIIEPIARRLGRKSVESTLAEFATAVHQSAGQPAQVAVCT